MLQVGDVYNIQGKENRICQTLVTWIKKKCLGARYIEVEVYFETEPAFTPQQEPRFFGESTDSYVTHVAEIW
jgi:hypothetical protein